jgi:hypothetical protein
MRRAADFESTTPVAAKRSTQVGISSLAEIVVRGSSPKADASVASSNSESSPVQIMHVHLLLHVA